MRTIGTARLLGVAVVLTVLAAGCGRGGGEAETVEVVRELDLLQAVEDAGTVRVSWRVDLDVPVYGVDGMVGADPDVPPTTWARMEVDAEGLLDLAGDASSWAGTAERSAALPEGAVDEPVALPPMRYEARSIGADAWYRVWHGDADAPAWIAAGDTFGDGADTSLADVTAFDPTVFLAALREHADSVTIVGEEEVRGETTTRQRAVVSRAALDEHGALWPLDEDATVAVDVWTDAEERLRRVEVDGLRIELWDFGAPVSVEAPSPVGAEPDPDELALWPTLTGDWAVEASGEGGGGTWQLWAAPADAAGTPTTCRTLETTEGVDLGGLGDVLGDGLPLPNHDGIPAGCGSSTFGLATGTFVADPGLQIVTALADDGGLLAFVVREDLATDDVTLELADGTTVDLPLDAGVAVWAPPEDGELVAVVLDGGAVRCAMPTFPGDDGASIPVPTGALGAMGVGPGPCIRT